MVNVWPFEVELVEPESGRRFTEHSKDGKAYFESEPDAEYFISVKQIAFSPSKIGFRFKIDGQPICGEYQLRCGLQDKYGLLQIQEGMRYHKALKFVKPPRGNFQEYNGDDGKIVMETFEFELGPMSGPYNRNVASKINKASDRGIPSFADDSKFVRTAEGNTRGQKKAHIQYEWIYGRQLGACTMHYCSAEKLVAIGVLPRAPLSATRRPAAALVSPSSSPALVRHPKRIRVENSALGLLQEYDLFDLTGEVSDDED